MYTFHQSHICSRTQDQYNLQHNHILIIHCLWNIFYMLRLLCLSLYSLLVYICICYLIICIPLCIMCIWLLLVRNLIHPHKHHYLIAYQIRITCIYLKFHNASSLRIILRTGCLLTEKMVCIYSMLLNCQRVHNFRLMV